MRYLMIFVAVLAGLYGGYWFIGRHFVENGFEGFFASMVQDGWDITYSDLSTQGFPSRFDTTITDFSVTHPRNGISWSTPLFQVLALSYRPTGMIAVWPEQQVITLPGDRLTVTAEGLRASAGVALKLRMPLDKVTVESGPMTILSDQGWQVALDRMLFAFRAAGPGPADYEVFLESENILPPVDIKAMLDPAGTLPATVGVLRVDAGVTLDQPLDRNMRGPVVVRAIDLRDAQMTWGDIVFSGNGSLTVAADGTPDGQIMLNAQNWRQVIGLGVAAGVIPQSVARLVERAGGMLAGGSDTLSAPLIFKDGLMSLGPIPLGPAPILTAG